MRRILRTIARVGATFRGVARSHLPMPRFLTVLGLLALLLLPSAARADGWDVIEDCRDEVLTKTYTQAEYDEALQTFPSDGREYSGCYEIILDAKRAAAREAAEPPGKHRGRTEDGRGPARVAGTTGTGATPEAGTGSPVTSTAPPVAGGSVSPPYVAPTPQDAAALSGAARDGERRLRIGGAALLPGLPAGATTGLADYPAPVVALLAVLGGALLLGVLALLGARRLSARRW